MNQLPQISRLITSESQLDIYKAPKGKLYSITDVHTSIGDIGNNVFLFLDSRVEVVSQRLEVVFENYFLAVSTDAVQNTSYHFSIPVKTKWITVGPTSGNSASIFYVIVYELLKGSIADLVWEFIGKGR